ncbi:MAG: Hpt domain-containing protein, partial [Planctomycetota bacterium]
MSEFDPEIMQDFLTESGELLEQLEGDLVQLESTPEDPELVNQTFRALHTIKGSGSFLALTNLVEIAHAAETALNAVRGGDASIDNDLMDMLLRSIDTLKVQFDELSAGSTELTKAELDLVEGLSKIGVGGDASASAPAGGDAPAGADDSAGRPLALDSSKMDLLEHFVADLDAQLEAFGTHIDELGDESTRSAAADNIADVLQELDATVDFFEFDAMLEITRAVGAAACNAPGLDGAMLEQLLPRLRATRVVLRRQRDGLAESRYFEPSMGSMIERIASLADGVMPDGAELPDGASDEDVLAHDGFDDGSDDGAPEGTIEDPSAAPAPVGDAGPADQGGPDPRQTGSRGAPAVEQTIRVEVGRLESLMNLVGELVLQKNRIGELAGQVVSSSD